jgi:hypothetical protein
MISKDVSAMVTRYSLDVLRERERFPLTPSS